MQGWKWGEREGGRQREKGGGREGGRERWRGELKREKDRSIFLSILDLFSLLNPSILNSYNPNPESGAEILTVFCSGMFCSEGTIPMSPVSHGKHLSSSLLCLGHPSAVKPTLVVNRRSQSSVLPTAVEMLRVCWAHNYSPKAELQQLRPSRQESVLLRNIIWRHLSGAAGCGQGQLAAQKTSFLTKNLLSVPYEQLREFQWWWMFPTFV